MKEFSQKILAISVENAPSTIEDPFTDFLEIHSDIDIEPSCQQKTVSGNSYFEFDLRVIKETLSDALISLLECRRPIVLLLFDTDGTFYTIGNEETPVRAIFNPVSLTTELKFKAILRKSPF